MSSLMPVGPQMKTWSTLAAGTSERSSTLDLLAVEPAVQDRNVLLLAARSRGTPRAADEAVLQFLQRLAKQHAAGVERLP